MPRGPEYWDSQLDPEGEAPQRTPEPEIFTAADLLSKDIPPPAWVVSGLLPEGLTLFAARPKIGKSWMALNISVCITHGLDIFETMRGEQGDVLYLALEDQQRRLKSRYEQMTAPHHHNGAHRLSLTTACPRLSMGGEEFIEKWVKNSENPRMVVVDTVGKVRPRRGKSDDQYSDTYDDMTLLKELADDLSIGVLGIHHTRKTAADDALEEVLGSTGFTGAADSIWVLKRKRGDHQGALLITGRDIEECSIFVAFDPNDGMWKMSGKGGYQAETRSRDAILDWAIGQGDAMKTFTPQHVSAGTGMSSDAARMGCGRLAKQGKLVRVRNGVYRIPSTDEAMTRQMDLEDEDDTT